ncbi:MAG TPA: penicillin-binding protein 2 [Patescibacteria group bacterium]|nr:penicillin-binding protein 2 [Patescibacteria group bacterium]
MEQRLKLVALFFLIAFFFVGGKLFYWQVLQKKNLSALATRQHYARQEVTAARGKIFSKDDFPLALNRKAFLLYVNPQQIKLSSAGLKSKLKAFVKEGEEIKDFPPNVAWFPLLKDLNEETKKAIENLQITGLGFEESEKRFYPEASMSAQLLGFVGEDDKGQPKGYFGLEGYYDNELKGKAGQRLFEQDALGRPLPLAEEWEERSIAGRNLFLNLDRPLQFIVESYLKKGIEKYGASSGWVAVMDPQNGAVLAMAAYPSYDPSQYSRFEPDLFRNPLISSAFEPGSIFKVLVMAAAIDARVVKADDICPSCDGPRRIGDYTIKTWNDKYFPDSSMEEIIVHSDNVGMVYVGEKLGLNRFYDYLKKFGLGEKTNIDLQGEVVPSLREKKDWYDLDLAAATFGQGIAVTPIQMLEAVSVIANGGKLYQPQVVKKIFEDSRTITIEPIKRGNSISASTAKIITQMMVEAVEKGEAKWAQPKGYQIAGKTGTAQIPIAGHYDPEKTIASFIGFAPVNNPKFAMLVSLREPKTSPWGSETAAPLWFEIAKEIFRLWGIAPDY